MLSDVAGEWVILTAEGERGVAVSRVRTDRPLDAAGYPVNVSLTWPYPGDARGLPTKSAQKDFDEFEDSIAALMWPPGPAYLVLVVTGFNLREWQFQARSYAEFIQQLNSLLDGHPALPLEIVHTDDPAWKLWHRVRDRAAAAPG